MATTHHHIVVRHMDDNTFRTGCVTSDASVCAATRDNAIRDHIADMRAHGEYRDGDTHEIEFIPREDTHYAPDIWDDMI